jgi:membrane protein
MARLRDVPVVLRTAGAWEFFKRIVREILDDNLFTMAGGLAYSWLFAIFPFLIFLMNLFPFLVGSHDAETKEGMRVFLFAALPDPAAKMLWEHMQHQIGVIIDNPSPWIATVSLVFAVWAASKGIGVTMAAMERCYELERGRAFYTRRPMAFGLTLMVSVLVFALVLLLPMGAALKALFGGLSSPWATHSIDVVRGCLAVAVVMLILAVLYHFGPSVKHRWTYLSPGSVFVFLAWIAVALAFRYYVNHFGQSQYEKTYGSVGGTAVLLLLFYIDALVLLIGAQINSEVDFEVLKVPRGSRNFLDEHRNVPTHDDGYDVAVSHGAD